MVPAIRSAFRVARGTCRGGSGARAEADVGSGDGRHHDDERRGVGGVLRRSAVLVDDAGQDRDVEQDGLGVAQRQPGARGDAPAETRRGPRGRPAARAGALAATA
jgi:hypothetical protein